MFDTLLAYLNANSSDKYVSLLFAVIGVFPLLLLLSRRPKRTLPRFIRRFTARSAG